MAPTPIDALQYHLDTYTSFWTSVAAAQIFWALFAVGVLVTIVLSWDRPHAKRRVQKRTRIFDLPPRPARRSPPAEMFAHRPRRNSRDAFQNAIDGKKLPRGS